MGALFTTSQIAISLNCRLWQTLSLFSNKTLNKSNSFLHPPVHTKRQGFTWFMMIYKFCACNLKNITAHHIKRKTHNGMLIAARSKHNLTEEKQRQNIKIVKFRNHALDTLQLIQIRIWIIAWLAITDIMLNLQSAFRVLIKSHTPALTS